MVLAETMLEEVARERSGWEAAVEAANASLDADVEQIEIGGYTAERVMAGPMTTDVVVLHIHGGGFNAGSPRTHRALAAALSRTSRCPVVVPDYRLAPEFPFPAAV